MVKFHVHEPRWVCQACGYIFAHASIRRAGEAEAQPEACPDCGSRSLRRVDEAGF